MWANTLLAQSIVDLKIEDYNDQDVFNNFSGDWNKWNDSAGIGQFSFSFDTSVVPADSGASLKLNYSVPQGGFGGLWNSLLGKINFKNQYLDFTNLYGDLKNSQGNPTKVEDVKVTAFRFRAKGNGSGPFNHVISVEFKDIWENVDAKRFSIPDSSNWTTYEFPINEMTMVDLTRMKEFVFVISDFRNEFRSSSLLLDDLTLVTTETSYNASQWDDDTFLDAIEQRALKYFLTFTDTLGFALDRSTFSDLVSVGAIGFQLTAYAIGDARGWADGLEQRVEKILTTLKSLPMGAQPGKVDAGYRGFFYHFLEANQGVRKNENVELSLYDTMLLMWGVLTCKEHFKENIVIQETAQALYDSVQWSWMVDTTSVDHKYQFHLGWKPESDGTQFLGHVDGYTDEALLVDVLALGSDSYPTTIKTYDARSRHLGDYPLDSPDSLAASWTGSLFTYFFAACWLDLERLGIDKHSETPLNIWENNRRAIIAGRQFCIDHQDDIPANGDDRYTTYGPDSWGLTAVDNFVPQESPLLSEYFAFGALPTEQNIRFPKTHAQHVGTIPVYGAGGAIIFTPESSIAALRNYYSNTGLWIPLFGFGDAYSTDPNYYEADPDTFEPILDSNGNLIIHPVSELNGSWENHMLMGINEGPMLIAIENYRQSTIWDLTRSNRNVKAGLSQIFDFLTNVPETTPSIPNKFSLLHNYPNPFNPTTTIKYGLPRNAEVKLEIFNILGQKVITLVNDSKVAGSYSVQWNGKTQEGFPVTSGLYFYQIRIKDFVKTRKMLLLK